MELDLVSLLSLNPIDTQPNFLQANRSGNDEEHGALQSGLLYLSLTEPDSRSSYCMDIVLTSRDNLTYVLSEMTRLVAEAWPKMTQEVRQNLINLLSEFIATRGVSVEVLMLHIYRRMTNWLSSPDRQPFLLPLTVYSLLRLIPDHHPSAFQSLTPSTTCQPISFANLREKELILVDELLQKNFDRCAQIGRDLIRLLHGVARLEPIKTFWDNILQNFSSLSSHFTSLADILEIVTPQCFTQTLIPHEMEQWVRWMMKNVHCVPRVPVHRYQEFFQRRFFPTPESQSLRVCLLRYVVTYFYPDNEMLASTLIPRWNVVSWILSQSTCPVTTVNIKLALFYDWLFYKPNDCIMNLEPALLAIMNHLTPRSQLITFSLVDFLVKIVGSYYLPMTDRIIMSVRNGLDEMIHLGVVKTIAPLFDFLHRSSSPELLRSLRVLLGHEPSGIPSLAVTNGPNDIMMTTVTTSVINSSTNSPHVSTNTRRPSNPLPDSKLKSLVSDFGPPTDPRLTRGHAAILAGAFVPTSSNLSLTNENKVILSTISDTTSNVASGTNSSLNSMLSDESNSPSIVLHGSNQIPLLHPPILSMRTSQRLTDFPFVNNIVDNGLGDTNEDHQHEGDSDDVIMMRLDNLGTSKQSYRSATWSPPLLESKSQTIRQSIDQISDTPESLEFKIDDLRRRFQDYQLRFHYFVEPVDVNVLIEQLDKPIRTALEHFRDVAKRLGLIKQGPNGLSASQNLEKIGDESLDEMENLSVFLHSESVLNELGESMEALIQAVLEEDSFDDLEIAGRTAAVVCELIFGLFAQRLMPIGVEWSEEHLEDCLSFSIFIPFRHLWQMNSGDPKYELLLLLLTEMQSRQPRLGYHLLFYLKVSKVNDENMSIYRNFCASQESPNLRDSLFKDMQLLSDDNRRLFAYLLPDIFTVFSSELADDTEFLRLIVATLDPGMCNKIISEIVRGHLNLFPNNDLTTILNASLEWNSIEQLFFWQLINAHEIPTRRFLPLIRSVDPEKHPEACANLILLLKLEKPSSELMQALLSRSGPDDILSLTALHFWSCPDNQHSSRFCNILCSFIHVPLTHVMEPNSPTGTSGLASPNIRDKRRSVTKHHVSEENVVDLSLILTHLDSIRRTCKNISLLQDDDIQSALQSIACSTKLAPNLKDRFSDLLALAEDMPSAPTPERMTITTSPSNQSSPTNSTHICVNGDLRSDLKKPFHTTETKQSTGSKGGHSLRNLDSLRAAEAERRRNPSKRQSQSEIQSNEDECYSEDEEVLTISSSSDLSSDQEDNEPKNRPLKMATAPRLSDKKSKSSDTKRANVDMTVDRRQGVGKRVPSTRLGTEDEEEEDDEERSLEVVLIEDESGDETVPQISKHTYPDEQDKDDDEEDEDGHIRLRPPKRRKKSIKRFMLDD